MRITVKIIYIDGRIEVEHFGYLTLAYDYFTDNLPSNRKPSWEDAGIEGLNLEMERET